MTVPGRIQEPTYLKSSSEIKRVPIAPRSAASATWSGPYHARISSVASILKNLRQYETSTSHERRTSLLVEHDSFSCELRFFQLVRNLQTV